MNLRRLLPILILFVGAQVFAQSETRTSTIRGSVLDERSQQPVVRARVAVKGTKLGALADEKGVFRIENVPVGHYVVVVSAIGYSSATQEVTLSSARHAVLDFVLREELVEGDSITVTANQALAPINRVAAVSVTPFSIEDVNRYAAAFQDPSRMAQNFAGVVGRGTTNNYIVVRGGSPMELLWRLDGIEMPNPNHFGKNGSTGGLVSAFSSQMLGNSDFLTGAFPAEYGTKMSAVFDLHTRNGNTERFEGMAEISFNGMQAFAEGPVPGLEASSYLVNYRHSTIAVLRDLGLIEGDAMPDFDDAMLKTHLRFSERDQVDLTGLWGKASLDINNSSDDELGVGSGILLGGIEWQHVFSDGFISRLRVNHVENSFTEGISFNSDREEIILGYSTIDAKFSYLPSSAMGFDLGLIYQRQTYSIENFEGLYFADTSVPMDVFRGFANWNVYIVPELVFNAGLFAQYLERNNIASYEPRLSLAWSPIAEHTFSIAYGIHRQPQPVSLNFEFSEATHYVLGYTFRPFDDLMIKAEGYLKEYADVPIHRSTEDSFSFLNEGYAGRVHYEDLINAGVGRSYGVELTALKHYGDAYYVTATASYIRQEFAGSDDIWHFGTFDNRLILNILSGYDIPLSNSSTLTLSEKFTIAGGGMYTPIDLDASRQAGYEVYDSSRAFGARNPAYIRLDLNAELRFNWSSSALVVFVSALNALNTKNVVYRYYSGYYDGIREEYDLELLPILGLRFEF